MKPELSFALLGAITVFFWLVAQAWTLLVLWAESHVTRAASPASPARTTGPARTEPNEENTQP